MGTVTPGVATSSSSASESEPDPKKIKLNLGGCSSGANWPRKEPGPSQVTGTIVCDPAHAQDLLILMPGGNADHGSSNICSQAQTGCITFVGLHSGFLTREDLVWVRDYLEEKIPLDGSIDPLQILRTELREGLIRVVCTNDYTKRWIEKQIANSRQGWIAGSRSLFRPALRRYTAVIRQDMTITTFFDLVTAQNPGFSRAQLYLWHSFRLPRGDSLALFGAEPGMVQFLERRMGKLFCGAGQVLFKPKGSKSVPTAVVKMFGRSGTAAKVVHDSSGAAEAAHVASGAAEAAHDGSGAAEAAHDGSGTAEAAHDGSGAAEVAHDGIWRFPSEWSEYRDTF